MRIFLFFAFLLMPLFSQAEYRVFLLKIEKVSPTATPADSVPPAYRLVESTLDPLQYPGYYPVAADERVTYIETWRCKGNTSGFKPHCPNPKGTLPPSDSTPEGSPKG